MPLKVSDQEFIQHWDRTQSVARVAELTGLSTRQVNLRRRSIETRLNLQLNAGDKRGEKYRRRPTRKLPARQLLKVKDGTVLIFSDAHFWPGIRSTAFKALLRMIRDLKPAVIVCNGDAFDGAGISRHPRIGWDKTPTVLEELGAVRDRLNEIEKIANGAKLYWTLGNHCARYETFLAANAPQFEGVPGFSLKDHFPNWIPCWSLWINGEVVIKHRMNNGIHATHTNTIKAGKTIVTGHLHSLRVTPFTDYAGTRWGVDTGTLADPNGPQFVDYTEDTGDLNHRSGFAVLSFHGGEILDPELVRVYRKNVIAFRGQVINVAKE